MLTLWQRPEDQLGLIFLHLLIQQPPGTKTIQTCTAEGRPDLPENMEKKKTVHGTSNLKMSAPITRQIGFEKYW